MALSIEEALKLPIMKDTKLVAGFNGLSNQIKWVTIVEVLEDTNRLQNGEFLITTGFGLLDSYKKMEEFTKLLRLKKLSGVAIYTGFYIHEIPPSFLEAANAGDLPLIELPTKINFSAITKEMLEQIVNNQMKQLEYSLTIHQQLTQLATEEKGMEAITKTLSDLTNGSVVVCNEEGEPLQYAEKHYSIKFTSTKEIEINSSLIQIDDAIRSIQKNKKQQKIFQDNCLLAIHPIIAKGQLYGLIILIKEKNQWNEIDDIAIEHSSTVYAIDYLKQKAVDEAHMRIQGDFLEKLLYSRYSSNKDVIEQAKKLGHDLTKPQCVLEVKLLPNDDNGASKYFVDRLLDNVKQVFKTRSVSAIIRTKFDSIIALVSMSTSDNEKNYTHSIQTAEAIWDYWNFYFPERPLLIGIGRTYEDPNLFSKSAKEAENAVALHSIFSKEKKILHFDELGIYHLLIEMKEAGVDLKSFYEQHLGVLLEPRTQGVDLFFTLDSFFQNNQNIMLTSAKLFIHRHTLKYRLTQIEEKLGISLKSKDDLMKLQLSIMAYKLIHTNEYA